MHELFLTAVVPDDDLARAQALLQGLSGMPAHASVQRVLYFAGPPQPRGLAVRRSIPPMLLPAQARLWSELHQQLARQSFVLQARYAVEPGAFAASSGDGAGAGAAAAAAAVGSQPGTLRWTDMPAPTGGSSAPGILRLVTQRKRVDIADTRNLPAILGDNNYRFKSELIEESFSFFANGNEYALVRYHRLPASPGPGGGGVPVPLAALPSWDAVTGGAAPVDPSGQWLFFVRRYVVDDTSPDKMKQALEALEAVRVQLAGAFAFRPVDRRAHDTRIERPANNMPAPLPQKVRA